MEFHDKSIVITGAAGVFGRWIAARFAHDGARLCLSDNRGSALGDAPEAIAYLCSEKASFITGAVLSVDGGNSIGTHEPAERAAGTGIAAP